MNQDTENSDFTTLKPNGYYTYLGLSSKAKAACFVNYCFGLWNRA
jgi:hypothetical protein